MTDERERGRFLGLPSGRDARRLRVDDTEPRILGVPQTWLGFRRDPARQFDHRWVTHPIRWLQWRAEVRRLGPYAPTYENFHKGEPDQHT